MSSRLLPASIPSIGLSVMSSPSVSRTAPWIWTVVILLWPVALLNYLDRQMLAAMKTSMVHDIANFVESTSDAQWGFVLGSFKWIYALLSPFAGFIGDRTSRRHVIGLSLLMWSAATWATGYVETYEQLLWARALMGVSEAFYIPTALALIADFHRGSTRSLAVGVHQTAIYAGTILGGFAGYVADSPTLGWRTAFFVCGIVGVIYVVPLMSFLKAPPAPETPLEKVAPQAALRELLTNSGFLLMVLYFTLPALAGWVIRDWMPAILKEQFGLGQGEAGVSAVLYVQLASLVG
ncbi:MAG: MFS transporter, partial [Planctomycetales bacterium]|nr:MFS transporter [Planctomycetales bacterium]